MLRTRTRAKLPAVALVAALSGCVVLPDPLPEFPAGEVEKQAADVAARLEKVRGLSFEREVPVRRVSRKEAAERLRAEVEEEWAEVGPGLERAWKRLGLLPEDFDLRAHTARLLGATVAAWYDPEDESFFVIEDEGGDVEAEAFERVFVMAHELTHALDDQHFDLEAREQELRHDQDRQLAFAGLVEGSAMEAGAETAIDWIGLPTSVGGPLLSPLVAWAGRLAREGTPTALAAEGEDAERILEETPPILLRALVFPYLNGFALVNRVRSEYGWDAVADMYRDPPDSSEQVLFPERYFDRRDRPVEIALPPPPDGFEQTFTDRLGALGLRVLFSQWLGEGEEERADGWDGDRFALWRGPDGEERLVLVVAGDDEEAAAEIGEALGDLAAELDPSGSDVAVAVRGEAAVFARSTGSGDAAELARFAAENAELTRPPRDRAPDPAWLRWALFPASLRSFERSDEAALLGGHLLHVRTHAGGVRLSLLDRLALFAERNEERTSLWTLLGLVGFTIDRHCDAAWGRIPLVFAYHRRSEGDTKRLGWTLLPFGLVRYERLHDSKHFSLLFDLLLSVRTGPGVEGGREVRFLFLPLPGF